MKNQCNSQLTREKSIPRKGHVRSICWKLKSRARLSISRLCRVSKTFSRNTRETLCLEDFECDFFTLHSYYIYPNYPQKYERPFREKKPQISFLQHNTPIFQRERESYSSLMRINCSLFFFSLPLSYLERRFVPTQFQSVESILELRKFQGFAKGNW